MSHPSDYLELFERGPSLLRAAVAGLDREQILARPIPGRWSILEVVCHLADSEQAWCHRIKRVIAEHRPLLVGYDETRFTEVLGYQSRDLESELNLFEANRAQLCLILRGLAPVAWGRVGVHTEMGLVSLADMIQLEAEHVVHHIRHIDAKRKALGL